MSDTGILVWLCACLLLIIGLCAVVGYLLAMIRFLVERVGRTEDRANEDAAAIYTLTKALQRITARIDNLEGLE